MTTRTVALLGLLVAVLAAAPARAADFEFNRNAVDCYCWGMGVGSDGSVYGADPSHERVVRWSSSGVYLGAFAQPEGAGVAFHPTSIAEAPGGLLVVSASGAIGITSTGQFVRRLSDAPSYAVAVDGLGFAYLVDRTNTITKVPVAGGPSEVLSDPTWSSIWGITYDPRSGHLFIADESRSQVSELRTDGSTVRTFGSAGTGKGQLNRPRQVAVGPDGSVYVGESQWPGPSLKRFDAAGNETGTAGPYSPEPEGMAVADGYLISSMGGGMGALDLVNPTMSAVPEGDIERFAGALVRFNASSYSHIAFGKMVRFDWDFDGDGTTDLQSGPTLYPIASYRWREPGTYSMTVTATADTGGTATLHKTVTITKAGVALAASPSPAVTGVPITLDASHPALPETGIDEARWDLDGDGSYETSSGTAATTKTTFAEPGSYAVRVRLAREGGVVDEGELTLAVHPRSPGGPVGVSIDDGERFTNMRSVMLHVRWPAGADTVTVSSDRGFRGARARPLKARLPFTLAGRGPDRLPRTVYLRFDHGTRTYRDEIILDRSHPVVRAASVAPTSAAGAAAVRAHGFRVRLSARDHTSGVAFVQFASNRAHPTRRVRYRGSLVVRAAMRPTYVRVLDRAGNMSRWRRLAAGR